VAGRGDQLSRRLLAVAGALALALASADEASAAPAAPAPAAVAADISAGQLGWLRLRVAAPPGATVVVREQLPGGASIETARLTMEGPSSGRAHLAPWLCDRLERRFQTTVTAPGADPLTSEITVVTPSCRDRVRLGVTPRRPVAGRPLQVLARDRWHSAGLPLRLCIQGPVDAAERCRRTELSATVPTRVLPVAAPQSGRYRIVLRGPRGVVVRRDVVVGPRAGVLRLLATGDSEIQVLDDQLAARLRSRGVRVTSDAHVGSGLAKLFQLNWLQHAATFARTLHPDITVVFLGANDGYGIGTNTCCGPGWSDAYALRAAQMMRSYSRHGAGRVFWFLLPAPRGAGFQEIFSGVNRALHLAAGRVPGVRLVDLSPEITPGGTFHQTVVRAGRTVNVRQPDGVHLSVAGSAIAVDVLVAAMRAEGAL
jgi:lysophospholipase L1-like esterase